ncbi:MAG: NAD(P)/FAD-dependent oxidoreductase [Candidatus Geothermarchaeales archaeon]
MRDRTILILGGGIGGVVAANVLRNKLAKQHEVALVDRGPHHQFPPAYPWMMMGWRELGQTRKDLGLLEKKGIRFIQGEISRIDPEERIVEVASETLGYDYLIVSLGADLAPEMITGFADTAHHNYTADAALQFREALTIFEGGTIAMGISSPPFKCPAAPFESALLVDHYFRRKRMRDKVEIRFFNPGPLPMAVAGPKVGNMIVHLLETRGISYQPNFKLSSVDRDARKITSESGEEIGYDLLYAVPPHRSPKVIRDSDLANSSGWVPVDRNTLRTRFDDVYAIGDVNTIPLPMGKPLPKAGVFAHHQAEVVAHNVAAEIRGVGEEKVFDGYGECFLEIGFGKASMMRGNFYTEPKPEVEIRWPKMSRLWRWYKVLFEKWWMWKWF